MDGDLVGQTLLARYRVDSFVGHGGMADVYKVFDSKRAVTLAIKVLRPDLAGNAVQRFEQEAKLLQDLSHPHIVRFYEWYQAEDIVFIVMEYVNGSNLREIIKERGRPFSLGEMLGYFRPVCAALHYAHQKAVFHCDVKPSNILIGQHEGDVYVSDFGVARIKVGVGNQGTPTHMAPEQFLGDKVNGRTDIYALGIMLYELATGGNRPFKGDSKSSSGSTTEERLSWEHLYLSPPSPRQFNASVSPALETVIMQALAKRSNERFASTLDLLEALEILGDGQTIALPRDMPTRSTPIASTMPSERPAPRPVARPVPRPAPKPVAQEAQRPAPSLHRSAKIPARAGPALVSGVKAYVLVRVGDSAGQWFPVNSDAWVIGRGSNAQLRFSSPRVSRQHAVIRKGKGYYYVQDLGSTLGTLVNGRSVQQAQALRSGDVIRLGDVELEFRELP